ncbi:MAG: hypothetical protein NTX85_02095 [Candidatus Nomurabacteria bacterium]|nr:hypothetical protein [Candidatus Nomurabacteria bacterium]
MENNDNLKITTSTEEVEFGKNVAKHDLPLEIFEKNFHGHFPEKFQSKSVVDENNTTKQMSDLHPTHYELGDMPVDFTVNYQEIDNQKTIDHQKIFDDHDFTSRPEDSVLKIIKTEKKPFHISKLKKDFRTNNDHSDCY